MAYVIPCMNCGTNYPDTWIWYVCDRCGYRICPGCIGKHEGPWGSHSNKCSQGSMGILRGPKKIK